MWNVVDCVLLQPVLLKDSSESTCRQTSSPKRFRHSVMENDKRNRSRRQEYWRSNARPSGTSGLWQHGVCLLAARMLRGVAPSLACASRVKAPGKPEQESLPVRGLSFCPEEAMLDLSHKHIIRPAPCYPFPACSSTHCTNVAMSAPFGPEAFCTLHQNLTHSFLRPAEPAEPDDSKLLQPFGYPFGSAFFPPLGLIRAHGPTCQRERLPPLCSLRFRLRSVCRCPQSLSKLPSQAATVPRPC